MEGMNDERGNGDGGGNGRFEGYSHYKTISSSIAESIDEALDAYARLEASHAEGTKISAKEAAWARSRIKLAALKLAPELRGDAHHNEQYRKMLARWHGGFEFVNDDGEGETVDPEFPTPAADGGYFEALKEIRLQQQCPDWLEDWVIDIRTAGWEIGYLQAGRSVSPEPDVPDPDEEFEEMFADY